MDLNVAWNGAHNVKIEFDIAHQSGKCTEIVRQIQVSNAITPTVPPVPTIINVDPIECQNNPTQTAKLMNPPVAPATITVTQDGNPISYNATDSTFSYSVGTTGAHTIRAKYTNTAGSSQKDTVYTVYASASPIGDVWPNAVAQCENTAANLTFAFTNNNWVGYTHEQHIINPSGVDNVNGIVVPGTITTPILGPGVWKSYVKSTQGTNTCAPFTVYSDTATITVNTQFIADATITAQWQVCDNAAISGVITPKPGTPNNSVFKMYKQVGTGTPTLFQTTTYTGTPISYNTTGQIPQVRIWPEIDLPAGGCYVDANGDTATVNVNAIPASPSATITQPTCSLPTGQITINPTTGYTYSFDNWATYTTNNVSWQLASGTYQIKVKSASGCESAAVPAVINTVPTVPSAPVTTITQPTCTISTGQITITPVAWYTYSFDNWVTYWANNVSPQMAPGSYQIKVKSASGCESAPVTAIVSASPLPAAPSITQVSTVLSVQSPVAGAQYQWQKKNTTTGLWEDVAGATWTSYTVPTTWEYRTNIINNGCGPVASNTINAVITSIPNPTNPNGKLKMYPNPLQNGQVFTIDSLPQWATQVKIGIYDAKWATVRLMEAQVINRKVQIQLPFMASGLYFIRIQDKRNGRWYEGSEKIVVN